MVALFSGRAMVHAQVGPDGIDWVTVGAVGNQPWQGNGTPGDRAVGRGGVAYEYKIGRFEVTTAQWAEFFSAAYDRDPGQWLPYLQPPSTWGASAAAPNTPGGRRWQALPGFENYAVGNISWRMAAMYCNWLHNGKSTERSAFLNGAYDVGTFGYVGNIFTDQREHNPGARYWIPTWDEWLKAAHFDPNRHGPGQGGWWQYSTTSDTAPISNPPPLLVPGSNGQCNAGGWTIGGVSQFAVPLGAYGVTSPWGLYDTAGGTAEWTEGTFEGPGVPPNRMLDGSWWIDGPTGADVINFESQDQFPSYSAFDAGFRLASSVPSPSGSLAVTLGWLLSCSRNRRSRNAKRNIELASGRRLLVPSGDWCCGPEHRGESR